MRSLPTASRLDLSERCPASMVLPSVQVTTDDNNAGTIIHDFALVRSRQVGRDAALAEVPREHRDRCAAIDLSAIPAGSQTEVALAWNWRAGEAKIVGENIGRSYPDLGPDWFQGTIDVIGQDDDAVVIIDLKTGDQKIEAGASLQLGFAAVVGAALTGKDSARTAMLYLNQAGRWYFDRASLDAEDLSLIRTRLRGIVAARESAQADVDAGRMPRQHVGPWCSLCGAQRFCPSTGALVRSAAGWEIETIKERVAALSDEEAGQAWERLAVVEKIVDAGRKALRERAMQSPVPLPSGKVLAEVPWGTREKLTDYAKEMIERETDALRARGEIYDVPATQVRPVSPQTAGKARGMVSGG